MTSSAISAQNVSVMLPSGVAALDQVTIEVPRGTVCGLVGPNGAGKSTLLRSLLGLQKGSQGRIRLWGEPFTPKATKVAYMPQSADIDWDFPATVGDVVAMGMKDDVHPLFRLSSQSRLKRRERILLALEKVGMEALVDRPISELSGGQKKRTFFARELMIDPELYLLDEPFAGVDFETERLLTQHLRDLAHQGRTAFVVHHDVTSVPRLFDFVVLLNVRVFACGPVSRIWSQDLLQQTFQPALAPRN
jgi:manganese/zinc/iron transport system ATP- binding protein